MTPAYDGSRTPSYTQAWDPSVAATPARSVMNDDDDLDDRFGGRTPAYNSSGIGKKIVSARVRILQTFSFKQTNFENNYKNKLYFLGGPYVGGPITPHTPRIFFLSNFYFKCLKNTPQLLLSRAVDSSPTPDHRLFPKQMPFRQLMRHKKPVSDKIHLK